MRMCDTPPALEAAASELAGAERVFVDTEFESRREGSTLCLLQISRGQQVFLVDALALADLAPLRSVLEASEWVLHAGREDVPLIASRVGIAAPPAIFDTQIAWALLGPEHSVSLPYLVYRVLGIRTGKAHQTDDWLRRPLPASQLAYAAGDIEHLPAIFAELEGRADELGRAAIARQASAEAVWPAAEPPGSLSLDSFRNAWQLDPESQAALRFIIDWYNGLSPAERARAPEQKTLLAIASRLPESGVDLARIKGVPKRFAAEQGNRFAGMLMRATAQANAKDFVPIDPPPYATFEDILLDGWLADVRARLCAEVGVAPELVLPNRVLRKIRGAIQESGNRAAGASALDGWRSALLAEPLSRMIT